jgi:hypothetical protein
MRHKSATIFPKILMHLMMAKLAETCPTDVSINEIKLKIIGGFKILNFKSVSVSCTRDGNVNA